MTTRAYLLAVLTTTLCLQLQAQNTNYGLYSGNQGLSNSFFGYYAGHNATNASKDNVGVGDNALYQLTTGDSNIGIGTFALFLNASSSHNIAVGREAMANNTSGDYNIGIGSFALRENTQGRHNTALGGEAMRNNHVGSYNTVIGYKALFTSNASYSNTAVGYLSLNQNTTGSQNTATGSLSLQKNSNGSFNAAFGGSALSQKTTGSYNVAVGYTALYRVTSGDKNTGLGVNSGPLFSGNFTNTVALGYNARVSTNNQARLGDMNMTSIGGAVNFTAVSDGRFKTDVQEDVLGLAFINELRPVSYQLDRKAIAQFDNLPEEAQQDAIASTPHTGFIAQEVEATAQKLGFDRFDGVDAPANEQSRYGLRYASFVVPLVKSVQELSIQHEEQAATIQELRDRLETQEAKIEALLKLAQQRTTSADRIEPTEGASLEQNTPNPFSEATSIRMNLPSTIQDAYLLVTNLEGKQLFQQVIQERGTATLTLQANELPAGLYLYTLVVDGQLIDSKKMLITQ